MADPVPAESTEISAAPAFTHGLRSAGTFRGRGRVPGAGTLGRAVSACAATDLASAWRDPRRYLWMLGFLSPLCNLLPSQFVAHTGLTVFWWTGPIVAFVVIPVLDAWVGDSGRNPPEEAFQRLSHDRYYRWCTYLFLPAQLSALVIAGYLWAQPDLTPVDKLGLATTVGLLGGIGINVAHELGHRVERHERWLAKVALAQPCYGHFYTEHNRGHHVRVATPEDPASSRFGESLWGFLPRSVIGGFRSAVTLERQRLTRSGRPWLSPHNGLLQAWAMSAALFTGLLVFFGWRIAPYLAVQAVIGFCLLESVNYLEHYGLLRARRPDGRYERCQPRHSWNCDRLVTNLFLFHLQRHSDHHANPGRRYQTLRSVDEAPQLPAGYATMMLLAMFPPIWRRVMDPRVLAHYDGDIERVNLSPAARRRIAGRADYTSGTPLQDSFDVALGQRGDGHERVAAKVSRDQ